jgi:hypothetical protein
MKTRFSSIALVASSMLGFAACARGATSAGGSSSGGAGQGGQSASATSGPSGQGGQGGVLPTSIQASSTSSTSSTSSSGSAGGSTTSVTTGQGGGDGGQGGGDAHDAGPSLCGNKMLDTGEQCDGDDFGGKTCSGIGLGSGSLLCNEYCGIVASNCIPKESCGDGQDNDKDGDIDCLDGDCAMAVVCLDSCAAPQGATVPGYFYGNTRYHASAHQGSCTTTSGGEVIYRVTAPTTGTMIFTLETPENLNAPDFSLSIRTACGNDASEIACVDHVHPDGGSDPEKLSRDVTQGETLYVVVDSVAPDSGGNYNLQIDMPLPEGKDFPDSCSDFLDGDSDGLVDCDDPSACQSLPDCVPGASATGAACSKQTECAANHNDPICLDEKHGYVGGYCSEFCDLAAPDCTGSAVCADIGLQSIHGACLAACMTDADCRTGYSCVDKGLSSKVCTTPPESDCDDHNDNDKNGLIDCEDPGCTTSAACVAGSKATGQPCKNHNECFSGTNDPFCIDTSKHKYPGGYCSEFCSLTTDDCGPGAICTNFLATSGSANGLCFHTCASKSECRTGYLCLDVGSTKKVCVH